MESNAMTAKYFNFFIKLKYHILQAQTMFHFILHVINKKLRRHDLHERRSSPITNFSSKPSSEICGRLFR